jgi:glutathione-specific gamma-glutamylcyclotransferase
MSHRMMALTPELVALCWRKEEKRGVDKRWTPLTDSQQDALAGRLCREAGGEPLWVFAYGSLIWRPTFEAVEQRRATAIGWHRSFCMDITDWRGTPEQPGLMMALDRGGRCEGVAYRLPDDGLFGQVARLVRREILFREDLSMVRWIPLRSGSGAIRALVFWAGPTGEGISLKLPLDKVAWVLARACGYAGSGAEYLYNTVAHLEELGIRDRNLWRLQRLVAEEIALIHRLGAEPGPVSQAAAG